MLDTTTVAALADRFALGAPLAGPARVARGFQGMVWRLDTETGSYAVKELYARLTEAEAEGDVAFQEAVLADASEVSLPRPIRTRDGAVLAEAGDDQFRVHGWADLLGPDKRLDAQVVGRAVGAIHRVRFAGDRPVHPWYTEPVGAERWRDLSDALPSTGAPFADAFAEVTPELIALEALLEEPRDLQTCHRDLFADNLLPGADGNVWVIDWENCGAEDPTHELAVVLTEFAAGDPARSRALWESYRDAGGTGRLRSRGSFTMVIAQFGHFFESSALTWLNPASSEEDRRRAVDRFDEGVTDAFTVDRMDEILDAVAGQR